MLTQMGLIEETSMSAKNAAIGPPSRAVEHSRKRPEKQHLEGGAAAKSGVKANVAAFGASENRLKATLFGLPGTAPNNSADSRL